MQSFLSVFLDQFALQAEIPAPASVGGKAPGLDLASDRAAQPNKITPPKLVAAWPSILMARRRERHPAERFSAPLGPFAVCIPARGELPTSCGVPDSAAKRQYHSTAQLYLVSKDDERNTIGNGNTN